MRHSTGIISTTPVGIEAEDTGDLSEDVDWRKVTVAPERHGGRLDHALVDAAPEFSRNYLQQLIEAERVTVNTQVVRKASCRVKAGDLLTI